MRLNEATMSALLRRADANAHLAGYGGDDVERRVADALRGHADDDTRATTRGLAAAGRLRMDAVTAALLAHHGQVPAVVAAIAHLVGNAAFEKDERGETLPMASIGESSSRVRIGRGVVWRSDIRSIVTTHLPEIVRTAAIGRDVRDVVDVALPDRISLRVLRIVTRDEGVHIVVSGSMLMTGAELMAVQMPETGA